MGFTNYLTSLKMHLLRHIRDVFDFSDTSTLTQEVIRSYVKRLTSESAIPIPSETFEWLANYFKNVKDKGDLFVYDNVQGLWHFEDDDTALRNVLTDYFSLIGQEATNAKDGIFQGYAKYFFSPGRIPNLANKLKRAIIYTINKADDIVSMTEYYRYFKTDDGRRALLDMKQPKFNLNSKSFKETQPLLLQYLNPVPIATTDDLPTLFLSLIETYMMNDPEKIEYFHKVLAYLMAPYNYNQCLVYFVGDGRNGKSTILKVLQDILGPHAVRLNSELLNAKPSPSFKKDDALAATEGKSLFIFNEIDERMQASTQNMKDITEGGRDEFGNKIMTVLRPAYSRNYEVNICGTPLIVANSLINFGDWSMLDPVFKRLILVPFDYHITKEDPTLLNRLAKEYPKIQAWLYLNYFKYKGLLLKEETRPADFDVMFKQYRADADIIGMFFEDCVTFTTRTGDEMLRGDLYRMYKMYCDANGRHAIKNKGTNGFSNLIEPILRRNAKVVLKNGSYYVQMVKKTAYFDNEIAGIR